MQQLTLPKPENGGYKILCLGAHCDDIEIGCGGTLLRMIREYPIDQVKWVVLTSDQKRRKEAQSCAKKLLETVKHQDIQILNYQDGYLPAIWREVKEEFETLKKGYSPDIIFTHYRDDLHQDHRVVNELTWNTFRNHLILEYEIPKYDGDFGRPNFFVPLEEASVNKKTSFILECFVSQREKHWLDEQLLYGLMRLRGMECVSPSNYAEAFYARKISF